jgi:hypothetical protein
MIDLYEAALNLKVINVYEPNNETGYRTPTRAYDPNVVTDCYPAQPFQSWMLHGTVGTDTLRYWCEGDSLNVTQFLLPHDTQRYRDGSVHDSTHTVLKMIPDGRRSRHTGPCNGIGTVQVNNRNTCGVEYESMQNGTHDITDSQYVRGALIYAYQSALSGIPDYRCISHGAVAVPGGRRSDPWAGDFRYARHWAYVQAIRQDARIWAMWGLPQPKV